MRYILLLSCTIFLISCISRKNEIVRKSTIKLEGKNTNIRNLIDIDGYYTSDPSNLKYGGYIFFEDGSWAYFSKQRGLTKDDLQLNLEKSIEKDKKDKKDKWGLNRGVYRIQNDTIIIHCYEEGALLVPMGLSEMRYKVVNRQTLKYIFFKIRTADEEYDKGFYSPWIDEPNTFYFMPADSLPSSDNWLKEKKWIWNNESDWSKYLKSKGKL